MAELHETTDYLHIQAAGVPLAARFRGSSTFLVAIDVADSDGEGLEGRFLEWLKMSPREDLHRRSRLFAELAALDGALDGTIITATTDYLNLLQSQYHWSLRCSCAVYDFGHELVVTAPGVWSVHARQTMIQAIRKLNVLLSPKVYLTARFIPDIEAASIALVSHLSKPRGDKPPILRDGNVVIVCDCGEFTVESAAYKIGSTQPLHMKEIIQGEGISPSEISIDNDFITLFRAKMTSIHPQFATDPLSEQWARDFTRYYWENDMKPNFRGEHREWTYILPASFGCGTGQTISFSASELALLFDPVADKIVNLVGSQIKGVIDLGDILDKDKLHVIVSGGFGRSPYIQTRIKQTVLELTPYTEMHCHPGDEECTAVSRGGVLQGLRTLSSDDVEDPSCVTSRIIQANYGVTLHPGMDTDWLVREGSTLSALSKNRRLLPQKAISTTTTDGCVNNTVHVCYTARDGLQEKPLCTILWPSTGPKTGIELNFDWDGFHMEVSILHQGRELDGVKIQYDSSA